MKVKPKTLRMPRCAAVWLKDDFQCQLLANPSKKKKKTGCTAPPANRQRTKLSSTQTTEWTSKNSVAVSATTKTHAATQTNSVFAASLRHVTTPTLPPLRHTNPSPRHTARKRRPIFEAQHFRHMHHHSPQRIENSAHKVSDVPLLATCHPVIPQQCSAHATHHMTQAPFHPPDDGAPRSRGGLDAQSLRSPTDQRTKSQETGCSGNKQEVATSDNTNTAIHHRQWFVLECLSSWEVAPQIADVSKRTPSQQSQTCPNEEQDASHLPTWCTTLVAPKPISMTIQLPPFVRSAHANIHWSHQTQLEMPWLLHVAWRDRLWHPKAKQNRAVTEHQALTMQEAPLTSVEEQCLANSSKKETRNKNVSFDMVNADANMRHTKRTHDQCLLIDFPIGEEGPTRTTTTTTLAHSWTRPAAHAHCWPGQRHWVRCGVMPRFTSKWASFSSINQRPLAALPM